MKREAMNIIGVLSLMALVPGMSGCTDAVPRLPDLQRRATTYSVNSTAGEPLVNDVYLKTGWYSVLTYTMATNSTVPENGACGTLYPIYIPGNSPEDSNITNNTEVTFVACLRSYYYDCDLTYDIRVRNCDGDLQYYLTDTERNAAYCFSPSGTGPAGIPTHVNLGEIKVEPNLRFKEPTVNNYLPYLEFECIFYQQPDYFYHVEWFRNNESIISLGPSQNRSHLSLNESLAAHLGVNFRCGVRVSAVEDGYKTKTEFSAGYFAGIQFNNLTVWLSKSSEVTIKFKITVPIGCIHRVNQTNYCFHQLQMFDRNSSCGKLVTQRRCLVNIPSLKVGERWDPDQEYNFTILTKDETYADVRTFTLSMRTKRLGHKIWTDYQPESVNVLVTGTEVNKHKYCYSHVDPHMKTSDGRRYEQQRKGTFILYRNKEYNIEVYTPIGTYIQIRLLTGLYHKSMNIDIHMSPKDYKNTEGLCGYFDGDPTNDFRTRGGDDRPNNKDYMFSESWRLKPTDADNMFNRSYITSGTWMQENNFCYCDNSDAGANVVCSAKDLEGCIVEDKKDVTTRFCALVSTRNRRSTSPRFSLDSDASPQRTKRSAINITDEEANTTCTDTIGSALVATDFTELLAPGEVDAKIEQCIFDVLASEDIEAAIVHLDALNAIATFHMDVDPEYVANNTDRIAVFKQQSCPRNCSSQGTCVDGECQCLEHFHGADCSIDERNPLIINGLTDDVVCDKKNSDCNCFHVQTDNLIETFKFQYVQSKMYENETSSFVESISGNGEYLSLFEGIVCFDSSTNQQAFLTHYNLSISNDGITYSDPVEIYVYDSTCQQYTTDVNGRYNFNVMGGHCYISGVCYVENHKSLENACNVCLPSYDTTDWTLACSTDKDGEDSYIGKIIGGVVGGIAAVVVVGIVVYCVKKSKTKMDNGNDNRQSTENAHKYERPSSAMSSRMAV